MSSHKAEVLAGTGAWRQPAELRVTPESPSSNPRAGTETTLSHRPSIPVQNLMLIIPSRDWARPPWVLVSATPVSLSNAAQVQSRTLSSCCFSEGHQLEACALLLGIHKGAVAPAIIWKSAVTSDTR